MGLDIVAGSAVRFANQFTNLFSDNGTTGIVDLQHLQMQLLQNLGSKLDVIKKELDLIIGIILALPGDLDALPARTAATIYKTDIQGRMLDIDELINAFRDESQSGSPESANRLADFIGRSYVEFRSARNRLFFLFPDAPVAEDMLAIPIAALCMHYELICLIITDQPKSLQRVTRESYAAYFTKWLTGLGQAEATFGSALSDQRTLTAALTTELFYNQCKSHTRQGPELGIPGSSSYNVRLQRYARILRLKEDDPDVRMAQGLVARGLLANEDLPASITLEAVGVVKTYDFMISDGMESPAEKAILDTPVTLDNGSPIPAKVRDLKGAKDCVQQPETAHPPVPDLAAAEAARDKTCRRLISLASFVDVAQRGLSTLEQPAPSGELPDPGSPFSADMRYLFDLLGQRSLAWQRLLAETSADQDAARKATLDAIGKEWSALQADAARITTEYAAAEERVREAADPDLMRHAGRLLKPLRQAAADALASIEAAHRRVVHDIEWNLNKAISDTGAELGRAAVNIEVAASATIDFIEAQKGNLLKTLDREAAALRQGKIIDAVWAATLGRVELTQESLSDAVLKSSLLKDIAMSAASIYGGPVGTAAFTAWYTYRVTGGDLQAAIKAGVIAGLSSAGTGISKDIPYTELTRRTMATAVIGGAAVAAAGGNEQDIMKGFLTGTALTMANAYYASQVERDMDGRVATEGGIDKSNLANQEQYGVLTDANGDPALTYDEKTERFYLRIDTNNIPVRINQVGLAYRESLSAIAKAVFSEQAIPMRLLGEGIPMMNAMAAFHDRMCDVLGIENTVEVAVTIIPASILTVSTSDVPLEDLIISTLNAKGGARVQRDDSGFLVVIPPVAPVHAP